LNLLGNGGDSPATRPSIQLSSGLLYVLSGLDPADVKSAELTYGDGRERKI
jgi:hypothetical protein